MTVLSRTENILMNRADNIDEFLKQLEKQKGITGYSDVHDKLQMVSENKELLDNRKDQTLQEITHIVEQIESEVKNKKQKLAPEIKKLRALRQRVTDLEAIYNEKKKQYDNIVMNLDQEKVRLEEDVKALFEEYKQEETKYHYHNI